jgi:hypothetical protein
MKLKYGFVGAKAAKLCGQRFDNESQNTTIEMCRAGTLDAAVVSVKSGKNGCNLQGMNIMVSLGYIGQASEEEQAKGIVLYNIFTLTGEGDAVGSVRKNRRNSMYFGSRVRPMIRSLTTPTNTG